MKSIFIKTLSALLFFSTLLGAASSIVKYNPKMKQKYETTDIIYLESGYSSFFSSSKTRFVFHDNTLWLQYNYPISIDVRMLKLNINDNNISKTKDYVVLHSDHPLKKYSDTLIDVDVLRSFDKLTSLSYSLVGKTPREFCDLEDEACRILDNELKLVSLNENEIKALNSFIGFIKSTGLQAKYREYVDGNITKRKKEIIDKYDLTKKAPTTNNLEVNGTDTKADIPTDADNNNTQPQKQETSIDTNVTATPKIAPKDDTNITLPVKEIADTNISKPVEIKAPETTKPDNNSSLIKPIITDENTTGTTNESTHINSETSTTKSSDANTTTGTSSQVDDIVEKISKNEQKAKREIFIQVGYGKNSRGSGVVALKSKVSKLGYSLILRPSNNEENKTYALLVGPFETSKSAEQALEKIKAEVKPDAYTVRARI